MGQEGPASASGGREWGTDGDVGMLGQAGGAGRGNFPPLGCSIPVWFRKNQWDRIFRAPGYPWDGTGMPLECHSQLREGQRGDHRNRPGMRSRPRELLAPQFLTFPGETSLAPSPASIRKCGKILLFLSSRIPLFHVKMLIFFVGRNSESQGMDGGMELKGSSWENPSRWEQRALPVPGWG